MAKTHFITFANSGYTRPDRILNQAVQSGFFDSVRCYSERDILPLIKRHRVHFIKRRKHGFGRFMWKPYILLKRIEETDLGDFVIYADSGTHIDATGRAKLHAYLDSIEKNDKSLGVFDTSESYKAVSFVRKLVVESYLPSFYSEPSRSMNSVYAGLVLARKTTRIEQSLKDWLFLCEKFLTKIDLGSKRNEIAEFLGQDADSGMLPLVLAKHDDYLRFPGTEVNLYDHEGFQQKHRLEDLEYAQLDWGALKGFPFTLRRDR